MGIFTEAVENVLQGQERGMQYALQLNQLKRQAAQDEAAQKARLFEQQMATQRLDLEKQDLEIKRRGEEFSKWVRTIEKIPPENLYEVEVPFNNAFPEFGGGVKFLGKAGDGIIKTQQGWFNTREYDRLIGQGMSWKEAATGAMLQWEHPSTSGGFTLGAGQKRYDAEGKVIAEGPSKPEKSKDWTPTQTTQFLRLVQSKDNSESSVQKEADKIETVMDEIVARGEIEIPEALLARYVDLLENKMDYSWNPFSLGTAPKAVTDKINAYRAYRAKRQVEKQGDEMSTLSDEELAKIAGGK